MGDSGFKSSENGQEDSRVESISLTEIFEDLCPIYMGYGMSYDEYWYGDAWRPKYYREAYKLRVKQQDEGFWMQGVYIYEALCEVSPILHAFSKPRTKPLPYRDKPMLADMIEKEKISPEQQAENERLIAQIQFDRWMKATAKQIGKK